MPYTYQALHCLNTRWRSLRLCAYSNGYYLLFFSCRGASSVSYLSKLCICAFFQRNGANLLKFLQFQPFRLRKSQKMRENCTIFSPELLGIAKKCVILRLRNRHKATGGITPRLGKGQNRKRGATPRLGKGQNQKRGIIPRPGKCRRAESEAIPGPGKYRRAENEAIPRPGKYRRAENEAIPRPGKYRRAESEGCNDTGKDN